MTVESLANKISDVYREIDFYSFQDDVSENTEAYTRYLIRDLNDESKVRELLKGVNTYLYEAREKNIKTHIKMLEDLVKDIEKHQNTFKTLSIK